MCQQASWSESQSDDDLLQLGPLLLLQGPVDLQTLTLEGAILGIDLGLDRVQGLDVCGSHFVTLARNNTFHVARRKEQCESGGKPAEW